MYKVMLVDDEPAVIKGLSDLLDWADLDTEIVACLANGQEALSLIRVLHIDILITDICMPVMDGLALIEAARFLNPSLKYIVISAHDEFDYVRRALKLEVENYLLKPINRNELVETVIKAIHNIESDAQVHSPELTAFRNNVLDRWANNSIQDFELIERAALLKIGLDEREYQSLVVVPRDATTTVERLAFSSRSIGALQQALSILGLGVEVFIDRYANLAAILHSARLKDQCRESFGPLDHFLMQNGGFASLGLPVNSAYEVGASYKSAYSMLPYRFLEEIPIVFCDGFRIAQKTMLHLFSFDHAMEACNETAAIEAVRKTFEDLHGQPLEAVLKELLPFELKLLSYFNDATRRFSLIPGPLLKSIRGLTLCTDSMQLLDSIAEAIGGSMRLLAKKQNAIHPAVRKAQKIIAATYDTDIKLTTIANQLHINPSYFGQLFRSDTSESFNDYLTAVRLQQAGTLLTETDLKINEIIKRIGIAQQSYFNRVFKNQYGMTPLEYRRNTAVSQRE